MESNEEISKWDIALEALAREECSRTGRALDLEDFQRLAKEYAIRLDDIMVTLFELVIAGEWEYREASGERQCFERETLESLYVNRRLKDEDLEGFTGTWRPL